MRTNPFFGRLTDVVYSNAIPSYTPNFSALMDVGLGPQWSSRKPIPAAISAFPIMVILALLADPKGNPYPPHTQIT